MSKLKVGDIVRLNDVGLRCIFGNAMGLSYMKNMTMKITWIDSTSMTYPEISYNVEVDNTDINGFIIADWCFDLVGG